MVLRIKLPGYIRISNLIDPLISRVDTEEIAFLAAYDLSFVEDTAKATADCRPHGV